MKPLEICIVDDNSDMREALRALLERAGYLVSEAHDGNAALYEMKRRRPALAIVDIIMPDREGLSLITELKDKWPQLPIVAISGGGSIGSRDYLEFAMSLGADAAFAKPFREADLLASINRLLQAGLLS